MAGYYASLVTDDPVPINQSIPRTTIPANHNDFVRVTQPISPYPSAPGAPAPAPTPALTPEQPPRPESRILGAATAAGVNAVGLPDAASARVPVASTAVATVTKVVMADSAEGEEVEGFDVTPSDGLDVTPSEGFDVTPAEPAAADAGPGKEGFDGGEVVLTPVELVEAEA